MNNGLEWVRADDEWSVAVGLPEEPGQIPHDKSGRIRNVFPWGTEWPPPADAGNYADEIRAGRAGKNRGNDGDPAGARSSDGFADTAPVGSYPLTLSLQPALQPTLARGPEGTNLGSCKFRHIRSRLRARGQVP